MFVHITIIKKEKAAINLRVRKRPSGILQKEAMGRTGGTKRKGAYFHLKCIFKMESQIQHRICHTLMLYGNGKMGE